jgi:bacteriocin biosynthesis cyclodehydratase domain-containing protein
LAVRPKLKQDSVFFQTQDGVFFQSEKSTFLLHGKTVYRWLVALSPHMTGEHTLDEISAGLGETQRRTVVDLVHTLLERGVLKDSVPEDRNLLPEEVRRRFLAQIEFIDHYADRPVERFRNFRQGRLLIAGSGHALDSLAAALLRNGLQNLHIVGTGDLPERLTTTEAEAEELHAKRVGSFVTSHSARKLEDTTEAGELIVYCSITPDLGRLQRLNAMCFEGPARLLPAVVLAGRTMIGPLVEPGQPGCWLCAVLRFASNLDPLKSSDLWRHLVMGFSSASDGAVPATHARILGNAAAFECFKLLGGHLEPETRRGVLFQDHETFESYTAPLLPHPQCSVCASAKPEEARRRMVAVTEGEWDQKCDQKSLLRRCANLIDPNLGIFQRFDDETLPQLPLKNSCLIGSAAGSVGAGRTLAHSTEHVLDARCRALANGLSRYAQSLAGARTTLVASFHDLKTGDLPPIRCERFMSWRGTVTPDDDSPIRWLPARSLVDGVQHLVPAAAAFPASPVDDLGVFDPPARPGVAASFYEVRQDALLSGLGLEAIGRALSDRRLFRRIDLRGAGSDEQPNLCYLIASAERLGAPVALVRVMSSFPVSVTLALSALDSENAVVGAGFGLATSASACQALQAVVGRIELREAGVSWDMPDLLPVELRPLLASVFEELPELPFENEIASIDSLLDALRTQGRDALFVDITPPDLWQTETFVGGLVLLTSDAPDRRVSR